MALKVHKLAESCDRLLNVTLCGRVPGVQRVRYSFSWEGVDCKRCLHWRDGHPLEPPKPTHDLVTTFHADGTETHEYVPSETK